MKKIIKQDLKTFSLLWTACLLFIGVQFHPNHAGAELISAFVTGSNYTSYSAQPWDTATTAMFIDPEITEWVAWNNLDVVSLTHPDRPGETLLGPGGYGMDDYLKLTVTNPIGVSLTVDMDRNTAVGNSYGPQNVIFGTSEAAPDVYRRSPAWGSPSNTDYFFDEAGAFNLIFTVAGEYTFRFDFWDNSLGPSSHPDIYLLAETRSAPVPEPTTMLLLGSGLAGLAALRKRRAGGPH